MSRVINANDSMLFASDSECLERRAQLINAGIIVPANTSELIQKKDGSFVVSTIQSSKEMRKTLISSGLIDPNLCRLLPEKDRPISNLEEGEYKPRPIKTEQEYLRRKQAYFRIMQEILFSRKDLGLVLGKKEDGDPDWYF